MKIKRYFIRHTSDESGLEGFAPLWIPKDAEFDPSDLQGMLHDMFEHGLTDKGRLHEEAMAFGRIIALRVIPGVQDSRYRALNAPNLGEEFSGIWTRSVYDNDDPQLKQAPKTARLDCKIAESIVQELMKCCMGRLAKDAADYSDDKIDLDMPIGAGGWLLSWLRIGYRDALRRYGQQDHECWDVGHAVNRYLRDNKKRFEAMVEECGEDTVLRLCFDTKTLRMTDSLIEASHEYGQFPSWLSSRIWKWHNGRA